MHVLKNKSYANYHQKHDFNILCVPHLEHPRIFPIWSSRSRAPASFPLGRAPQTRSSECGLASQQDLTDARASGDQWIRSLCQTLNAAFPVPGSENPLVALLEEHGTDESEIVPFVWEDTDNPGPAFGLVIEAASANWSGSS